MAGDGAAGVVDLHVESTARIACREVRVMECLVCRRIVDRDGLEFWGATICPSCQRKMLEVTADQPEYGAYVMALRRLWRRQLQAARDRRLKEGEHLEPE